MDVGAGEIVGLTGLAGAGYEDVLRYLFGAAPAARGTLHMGAKHIDLARLRPGAAIGAGIAFLPGDRLGASGIGSLSLADNVCVLSLEEFKRRGLLRPSRMLAHAAQAAHRYEVRPPRPELPLSAFSGGNAQKALLAKWLHLKPSLLLLEEPTQGVDVGARQNLWRAIRGAAEGGAAVLCSSSDHEQLARLCDRVLVFRQGRIIAELKNPGMTKDLIAARCYG
jgi:ribose transport system ATP-binding protein